MDVAVSCFKIKLLKAMATTKEILLLLLLLLPPPPHQKNVAVRLDHFLPQPNKIDQGGVRRGVIG